MAGSRDYGMGRGKVFPADKAGSLLSPLRRIIQPPERVVARAGLAATDRVLEIGCGPGYFSSALADAVGGGQVVLFDLQLEMLDRARDRVGGAPSAAPVQGDATHVPFTAGAFDAAFVVLVLGEVPDRRACVNELHRVVRRGGCVLFAETRRDGDFIRLPALRKLVESAGFDFAGSRGPRWEYTATFRRA